MTGLPLADRRPLRRRTAVLLLTVTTALALTAGIAQLAAASSAPLPRLGLSWSVVKRRCWTATTRIRVRRHGKLRTEKRRLRKCGPRPVRVHGRVLHLAWRQHGELFGRLTLSGKPIAGAPLTIAWTIPNWQSGTETVITGRKGRFSVYMPGPSKIVTVSYQYAPGAVIATSRRIAARAWLSLHVGQLIAGRRARFYGALAGALHPPRPVHPVLVLGRRLRLAALLAPRDRQPADRPLGHRTSRSRPPPPATRTSSAPPSCARPTGRGRPPAAPPSSATSPNRPVPLCPCHRTHTRPLSPVWRPVPARARSRCLIDLNPIVRPRRRSLQGRPLPSPHCASQIEDRERQRDWDHAIADQRRDGSAEHEPEIAQPENFELRGKPIDRFSLTQIAGESESPSTSRGRDVAQLVLAPLNPVAAGARCSPTGVRALQGRESPFPSLPLGSRSAVRPASGYVNHRIPARREPRMSASAPAVNSVTLVGNLTANPILKQLDEDRKVCQLHIAVNDVKDQPMFIDVATFGAQADACARYLTKGRAVAVTGRLVYRQWDNNGTRRSRHHVVGRVQFGGKLDNGEQPTTTEHDSDNDIAF